MLHALSIGHKITQARKKLSLSQAELAKQVNISPQAVGKWERGESMPDITTLNRLAEIFNVDLNFFSERFDPSPTDISPIDLKETIGLPARLKDDLGLNWNMSGENYVEADFSGIKNIKEKLNGSGFKKCKFIEADLSGISFRGNSITGCDFQNANLRTSRFWGSEVRDNSFVKASLIDASMEASEIRNCDFSDANLSGITLAGTEFRNNKIENVNWQHAAFKRTQFTEMVFNGLLEDCSFTSCAFSKTAFRDVTIRNSFFKYSDLKRVEFIDCQADRLSFAFLKNNKANLDGISILES
ncbi:MAG TPA: pentapeptide repeat-containing protein [Saprospiraceae bacterium]|nr:pentapeptide repeat-containing protein [Saprospiraceae bacterium]